jgi:ABC-2 type transport system permease protein
MVDWWKTFVRINETSFRLSYGWMQVWVYVLTLVVRPAAQVIFFGVMARFITGSPEVSYQVIGNTIQVCALVSLYGVAENLLAQRRNGTLALLVLAPRSRLFVFAGQVWLLGLHGLVVTGGAFVIGASVFGLELSQTDWAGLVLAMVVTVLATSGLGTALGSLGLHLPDIHLAGNLLAGIMMAICGINFPVSALPAWLARLSQILPMTRGAAAARLAVAGGGPEFAALIVGELVVGLAWFVVGYLAYRWAERQARLHATLDLF